MQPVRTEVQETVAESRVKKIPEQMLQFSGRALSDDKKMAASPPLSDLLRQVIMQRSFTSGSGSAG